MACISGQAITVPIIVKTLAETLAAADTSDLPLPISPALLALLDAGIDMDKPSKLVDTYYLNWWDADDTPNPDDVLTTAAMDKCLEIHHAQLSVPAADTATHNTSPPSITPSSLPDSCATCPVLQAVADDLLKQLLASRQMVSQLKTRFDLSKNVSARRDGGFSILHEKSLAKETSNVSTGHSAEPVPLVQPSTAVAGPSRATRRSGLCPSKRVEATRHEAVATFNRLRALPVASHKWTWGTDLTMADVLEPVQGRQHTGYHRTLPDGRFPGVYSGTATHAAGTAAYSDMGTTGLVPSLQGLSLDADVPAPLNLAAAAGAAYLAGVHSPTSSQMTPSSQEFSHRTACRHSSHLTGRDHPTTALLSKATAAGAAYKAGDFDTDTDSTSHSAYHGLDTGNPGRTLPDADMAELAGVASNSLPQATAGIRSHAAAAGAAFKAGVFDDSDTDAETGAEITIHTRDGSSLEDTDMADPSLVFSDGDDSSAPATTDSDSHITSSASDGRAPDQHDQAEPIPAQRAGQAFFNLPSSDESDADADADGETDCDDPGPSTTPAHGPARVYGPQNFQFVDDSYLPEDIEMDVG